MSEQKQSAAATAQPQTNRLQSVLKALKQPLPNGAVKERYGWKNKDGSAHFVSYVEWHVVCDILDEYVGDWSHKIVSLEVSEKSVHCVASITICGVTREGVGASTQEDDSLAIKAAESDALKRAAVKFGVGRELYKKEDTQVSEAPTRQQSGGYGTTKPTNPTSGPELSEAQRGKIKGECSKLGLNPVTEIKAVYGANIDVNKLSKAAASYLINQLIEGKHESQPQAKQSQEREGGRISAPIQSQPVNPNLQQPVQQSQRLAYMPRVQDAKPPQSATSDAWPDTDFRDNYGNQPTYNDDEAF